MNEVEQVDWSVVCHENNPEIALNIFMNLFMEIANRHAPLKKVTVRSKSAPWLDKELLDLMMLRENAKKTNYCRFKVRKTSLLSIKESSD